jgi:3-methyladenine DNA glycosylase/8-oxoguanine DNA glycosylase
MRPPLSSAIAEGHLNLEALVSESDGAALDRLSRVRGVGRWTGEYVLLRGLRRLHVFPDDAVESDTLGARARPRSSRRSPKGA